MILSRLLQTKMNSKDFRKNIESQICLINKEYYKEKTDRIHLKRIKML